MKTKRIDISDVNKNGIILVRGTDKKLRPCSVDKVDIELGLVSCCVRGYAYYGNIPIEECRVFAENKGENNEIF